MISFGRNRIASDAVLEWPEGDLKWHLGGGAAGQLGVTGAAGQLGVIGAAGQQRVTGAAVQQ